MAGVNPVSTYNPALLPQQQQPATSGMTDLQKELAGANALGVEGTTQILPQILAIAQQTTQMKEATKANNDLKQKNAVLEAQVQAMNLKGQQSAVQGQALQQLQATTQALPQQQLQQPATQTVGVLPAVQPSVTPSNTNFESQKNAAISSGNLGELAKVSASEVTSDAPRILKMMEDEKSKTTYRKTLEASGISKDQATALANQKFQADNVAATGQVLATQQPMVVQPPPQAIVPQPVLQAQTQPATSTVVVANQAPSAEAMVNVPGVGMVPKATLTALLQNTSEEAQKAQAEAQQKALQQQQVQSQTPPAVAAPRNILPTNNDTLQPQALTGFPSVAPPLALASVSSFGNSGITAEKYQQLLSYMNQQPTTTVATANTTTPSTTASTRTTEEDTFAKAKMEASKLGFDTSSMPNSYAEFRAKQKKRRKKLTAKNLTKPKLYVPKPDDSKYLAYGGENDASSSSSSSNTATTT